MAHRPTSIPGIDLPFALQPSESAPSETQRARQHAGDVCPRCEAGILDFDGLLNLSCPACGYSAEGGCHT